MVFIRNRLKQRILVNLVGGKNLNIMAKGTANVTEEELSSRHLQTLIDKGIISLVQQPVVSEEEPPSEIEDVAPSEIEGEGEIEH
ncbi:MAG: hypothetical protein C5S45_04930 [Candidatus Methanocomedens sp.]|nr:MAG: hypothetical protein C5S45_04930 [ANME-2 cluster archaeon]